MITSTDKIRQIKAIFGGGSLDVRGTNIAVACPACGGKSSKKKLSIHLETGRCHCWVCGLRSSRVSSIIYKHISRDVAAEYRQQCEGGGRQLDDEDEDKEQAPPPLQLPEDFTPIFSRASERNPDARAAARYLVQRGFSVDDIIRFRLGVAQSVRRRVVIPSFDAEGGLNFFTSRAIDPDTTLRYANCRVKKTDIVFNELNIDWARPLTVVEGPFDLMRCPDNSTCVLGSSLGMGHLLFQRIVTHRTPVVLALDSDMKAKAQRIAELLYSYDCDVRIAESPKEGKDMGDLTYATALEIIDRAQRWRPLDKLLFSISNIRSGSTI